MVKVKLVIHVLICTLYVHYKPSTSKCLCQGPGGLPQQHNIQYEIEPCICKSNDLEPLGFYKV